jgi:hypothetical protein
VLDIGDILDPVCKRVAVQACVERHAVSFIGRIQPRLDGGRHFERWRVEILLDGLNAKRRPKGDKQRNFSVIFGLA